MVKLFAFWLKFKKAIELLAPGRGSVSVSVSGGGGRGVGAFGFDKEWSGAIGAGFLSLGEFSDDIRIISLLPFTLVLSLRLKEFVCDSADRLSIS